jgi:NAD(P)-dependent dehydrogenase (short-subunit alcohol dehydrogenase family)
MQISLSGKKVLITGASRGIGRGIAHIFASSGAHVLLADVLDDEGQQVVDQIQKAGGQADYYHLDVRDIGSHSRLFDQLTSTHNAVDILVNNAGINAQENFLEMSFEHSLDVFETNLHGPLFLTQLLVKDWIQKSRPGVILFTSSTHSLVPMRKPAYSGSKAALDQIIREMAIELAPHKIRVNGVAPGMISIHGEDASQLDVSQVPLGYKGVPEDVARTMVFLASDHCAYVTGDIVKVDGGFSLQHALVYSTNPRESATSPT